METQLFQKLMNLVLEVQAEITFSMDSTCVNVQSNRGFICTPNFNTRQENLQLCIDWLQGE